MILPDGYRFCTCGCATKAIQCRQCGKVRTEQGQESTSRHVPLSGQGLKTKPALEATRRQERKTPNKTESAYRDMFLAGKKGAIYEGITFRLANGHRYTPDWIWHDGSRVFCVEVKGAYRFGSHQRARLAFDQARIDFPFISWVWATRNKQGKWCIK